MTLTYGSICSGIEAATVAWHPLGWRPAFFSEIDGFPRAVLAHHYPAVPLHGDFTTIRSGDYAAIDVLVGGTPCQSFSLAGLRGGLADERGNLALAFCRLARSLGPRWVVWENVPGVLSVDDGRAFASILGGLADSGYGLAYRVLDAQYVRVDGFARAVPQRRRRVFVVGYLGDWRRAAAVLFERQGLSWDPPPRRQAGQGVARPLGAGSARSSGDRNHADTAENLVAQTLTSSDGGISGKDGINGRIVAFGGNNQAGPIDIATAQTAHGGTGRLDFESETFVAIAGTLSANGKTAGSATSQDAENGLLLPVPFDETQITSATNRSSPGPGDPSHPLSSQARAPSIAFNARQDPDVYDGYTGPLDTDGSTQSVFTGWRVRRLMPVECERLQGFPDGYTDVPYRGRPAADGPRYKALGNSMAVNVMRWIGTRITAVERIATTP
jgi:DNA (cytosine-5)-methyltransferase 1